MHAYTNPERAALRGPGTDVVLGMVLPELLPLKVWHDVFVVPWSAACVSIFLFWQRGTQLMQPSAAVKCGVPARPQYRS